MVAEQNHDRSDESTCEAVLPPELVAGVIRLAIERGITLEEFTAEVLGQLLVETNERLQRIVSEAVHGEGCRWKGTLMTGIAKELHTSIRTAA